MAATYRFDVKWGDTDAAGIVFYPNFYKWMDEATHHFFAAAGFSSSRILAERQTIIPLLEAHCQFKSPLQFEDEVEVQSFCHRLPVFYKAVADFNEAIVAFAVSPVDGLIYSTA